MRHSLVPTIILATLILGACKRTEQPAAPGDSAAPAVQPPAQSTAAAPAAGIDVGSTLPEYSATWLDGSKFDLAGRREKVVLLNVWATWCGPCVYEIPELQALHERFGPRGFEVIGVSVDEGDVEGVRQFVADKKVTYPIALDPQGRLADMLQTSVLPTTVLLDRKGTIVWKKYGAIMAKDSALEQAIESAL